MFFGIGFGEFIVLALMAVFIFGPDRLPQLTQDSIRFLRRMREFATDARRDLDQTLGPEFADLDLSSLNPREFVRKNVISRLDSDELGLRELRRDLTSVDPRKVFEDVTGNSITATTGSGLPPVMVAGAAGTAGTAAKTVQQPTVPKGKPRIDMADFTPATPATMSWDPDAT